MCHESSSLYFVLKLREELKNHHNQRWSGSALRQGLVCLTNRIFLMCLPTWASPPIPQKRYANANQLVARLHPQAIVHPRPIRLSAKTYSENAGLRLASQQDLGLLLCQLEMHAGAADGKPSRQGWLLKPWCMRASGSRPCAILSHSHVCKSTDHLLTPFVDYLNYINTFKGPRLIAKLNKALLKLYLLCIMYMQQQDWNRHAQFSPSEIK